MNLENKVFLISGSIVAVSAVSLFPAGSIFVSGQSLEKFIPLGAGGILVYIISSLILLYLGIELAVHTRSYDFPFIRRILTKASLRGNLSNAMKHSLFSAIVVWLALIGIRNIFSSFLKTLPFSFCYSYNNIFHLLAVNWSSSLFEEIAFHLFLFNLFLLVFGFIKLKYLRSFLAYSLTAVAFSFYFIPEMLGVLSVPQIIKVPSSLILSLLVYNGTLGAVLNILYRKEGLESAVIAHFILNLLLRM
ncbi:CPBP family intramembrane metalloprotease [bacterium]|nr:CPBP family intramembrane metalloprotease [bacterium]